MCAVAYLDKVDESGENGTAQHVMILRLLPEQRQVLHQTAYVWPDLIPRRKTHTWNSHTFTPSKLLNAAKDQCAYV